MAPLRNAVDTWVDQFVPTKPHVESKRIWLRGAGTGFTKRGFIYFNRPFEWGQTLTKVELHMFGVGTGWGSRTVWVEPTDGTGPGYAKTTYNKQPGVTGPIVGTTQTNPVDGTEWVWDITAMCQAISDAGEGWYGFRLTIDNDGGPYKFYSSDAFQFRPYLEVEVSPAPEQPTVLAPDGSVVDLDKPTLRFDFADYSGNQTLTAVQVQIDAGNDFGAPDFDSGTVLTSVPELDLSTTAYLGLGVGATTFWRVRVRDGSNKWSPYSDPATFTRQTKEALVITNPPAPPNNFVAEWTPSISWTFAGTQTGYRVIVDRVVTGDLPNREVHDSEFQSGTDLSYQIPRRVLTEDGQVYKVRVRVHDQYERENLPGDTSFIAASREFTFQADGGQVPVTGLAAQSLMLFGEQSPFVKLTWSRATAPDSFVVKRDGKVIEADLDPSEALVSGTDYEWIDYGARPNISHTWKVAATTTGQTSTDVDVVRAKIPVTGIWLYDNDKDLIVQISGAEAGEWRMPETAETVYPVNSTRGFRVTQSLHPWEGSFSNGLLLRSVDGSMTGADWEDRMMEIKEHPGRPIWINAGDRAFRAILFEIVCPLLDSPEDPSNKGVAFGFIQTNDITFKSKAA